MFERTQDARRLLLKNKHTILEGYITEYLYKQQFLNRAGSFTDGWWVAVTGQYERVFFVIKEALSETDYRVIAQIGPGRPIWMAFPRKEQWMFADISRATRPEAGESCSENGIRWMNEKSFAVKCGFLSELPLRQRGSFYGGTDERQQKCPDFFENYSLLQPIALERHFADEVLPKYFRSAVNIDFFTTDNAGHICVEEVRFKFEDRSGSFGINVGQAHTFELLERLGFPIRHSILYNATKDRELSIFGFLSLQGQEKYWLRGPLTGFSDKTARIAPRETSHDGTRPQRYISFPKDNFHRVPFMRIPPEGLASKAYVASFDKYGIYHTLRGCVHIRDLQEEKIVVYGRVADANRAGYTRWCKWCRQASSGIVSVDANI